MKKRSLLLLLLVYGICSITIAQITLPAGTKMYFNTTQTLSSNQCISGQLVNIELRNDVIIDGKVIAASGTNAVGEVLECKKAKGKGTPGKIALRAKSITLRDGTEVMLNGQILEFVGKDNKTEAALGAIAGGCCILPIAGFFVYFFIPGENAHLYTGNLLEAHVSQDYVIKK